MKIPHFSNITFLALFSLAFSQQNQAESYAFSSEISALKAKSVAHELEIAKLLSDPDLQPTDYNVSPRTPPEPLQEQNPATEVPPAPYLPVPEFYDAKEGDASVENDISEIEQEIAPVASGDVNDKGLDLNTSTNSEQNQGLISGGDIIIQRHNGYYFGPLLGIVIPDNGAVRDASIGKIPYESETGYLFGLQFGKDFGTIRWEVEYSHKGFDGQGTSNLYEIGTHDFLNRILLEKEIGDLIDFRAGLGMGVGFISFEGNQDYSGESFIYDFILGASYRLRQNLNLSVDYRYFLTGAEDEYDRLKSHIFTVSANFDL